MLTTEAGDVLFVGDTPFIPGGMRNSVSAMEDYQLVS